MNMLQAGQAFLRYCKNQRQLSPTTLRAYTFDLKNFFSFLADDFPALSNPEEVTKHTLENYLDYLNNHYAVKTTKRRMACLRSFFDFLEYEELLDPNPFQRFRMQLKEPFRIRRSMSLREVYQVFNQVYGEKSFTPAPSTRHIRACDAGKKRSGVCRGTGLHIGSPEFIRARDAAVLELLFAAGLRVSELCDLRYEDLNLKELTVDIRGKGNKQRVLYLENSDVISVLSYYLDLRRTCGVELPWVFITKFQTKLSTQAVRNLVTKYSQEAGLSKKITPHSFRHTFASLLLEEGVDIKYIQEFLGHSSISTTQIYLHTSTEKKRSILSSMHPRNKLYFSPAVSTDNVKLSAKTEREII